MYSFLGFPAWIHGAIQIIQLKFFSWNALIFTPISTTTDDSILPNEIITDILLRLPNKSLLKCTCVSKSWHQLISSPHFVNTHLKLNRNYHRVLFPGINGAFKFFSINPLFNKQQQQVTVHMYPPTSSAFVVGSANGLICLCNHAGETYIWNPTIRKSKELLNSKWGTSFYTKYGFGYDDLCDDYKAVFVDYCRSSYHDDDMSNMRTLVNVYSLRTDSWTTLHDQLQGIYLVNLYAKFVHGKLYWVASSGIRDHNVRNIISYDVADEKWGSLELPICGEVNSNFKLGVVGSDLSLLYTCRLGDTTSDVWILKDCRVWTKLFTIEYPQNAGLYIFSPPILTFSMHLRRSNKGDILLSHPGFIMIFDGSTKRLEHTINVEGCNPPEIYAESIVNPLMISGHCTSKDNPQ
ncbi:F-box protein CPR1-like [Solanum dulcamara]|uniref:F-box protein CPR1-like n=1 Tax=Solanum dulcamara TaxID=45834 RepID=UPI0024863264|nr:F-box protein CPR1-like [Solanum dulcamara]XP_055817577.1 F-box protein CPR1-like [Solanum dulcamara]XP_055817578.1 F-box protein CPR1-like [Solanum dulcamara]